MPPVDESVLHGIMSCTAHSDHPDLADIYSKIRVAIPALLIYHTIN